MKIFQYVICLKFYPERQTLNINLAIINLHLMPLFKAPQAGRCHTTFMHSTDTDLTARLNSLIKV